MRYRGLGRPTGCLQGRRGRVRRRVPTSQKDSSHGWLAIRFAHERGALHRGPRGPNFAKDALRRCPYRVRWRAAGFGGAALALRKWEMQPRRRRRAAPRRTLSEQRTRRAATRRSTSRPADVCLRCIEKPSAVRGDRVRTVALSSMVLPCTASALAMHPRPASRRPAYQSAYATRRTIGHVRNLVHARRRPRSRYAGRLRRRRRWA